MHTMSYASTRLVIIIIIIIILLLSWAQIFFFLFARIAHRESEPAGWYPVACARAIRLRVACVRGYVCVEFMIPWLARRAGQKFIRRNQLILFVITIINICRPISASVSVWRWRLRFVVEADDDKQQRQYSNNNNNDYYVPVIGRQRRQRHKTNEIRGNSVPGPQKV
jgi:hypothetical protein